ncbi:MAG: leucyl aminopeptidase, partial [Sedimentisphaerales bacterium]|nr:leucyl aminopeptidase [Sedimentisphaerales bacterium]
KDMKEIIEVELKTQKVDLSQCKTDMLAVGHFSDAENLDKINKELDTRLGGAISRLIDLGDFKAKEGTSAVVYGNEQVGAKRILLVGLGEKKKATLDTLRKAAAHAAQKSVETKAATVGLALHKAFGRLDAAMMGQACAEGTYFGGYRYDEYITESENGRLDSLKVDLVDTDAAKLQKLKTGLARGTTIGKAQSFARTLGNRPANVITPAALAAVAKDLAKGSKTLSCTIFDEKQMTDKGMGGVLAVGSGSKNPPRFIVLKHSPGKAESVLPTVALVGKAITFDSGGISIKPSANMEDMKFDKCGGLAVLGAMKAVAELGLPLNVFGIIPSAENMPSGTSYRPGDIINTYSGKTVEVQNTDAEGRMILCDGLHYAVQQKCDVIIDIATLTGACVVALGKYMAGLMSNNDGLTKQLQKAADDCGEKVWPMPSGEEYAKEMKSKIADLKNISGRWGGACTAAAFLGQFVGETTWAHLDMAGVWNFEKATEFTSEGASGYGVRLLTTYLINLAKAKKK